MQAQARRFSRAGVMLIGLILALLTVVPAAKADLYDPADWAPKVWSDKADYAPGERVTLTGAHWQPGETVHIRVNDDTGSSWDRDVDVTADETGAITDQFNLPDWFVAKYRVTATGASGAVATTTFTDGNVLFALATADQEAPENLSWSVAWNHYTEFACATGNQDGSGSTGYLGNVVSSGNSPAVGNKQSAKPVSATAAGYVLDYWSDSPTSTTPLTATELCADGPKTTTLYAHFNRATQPTALNTSSATATYGGTTTLSATLTSGGSGVGGKTVTFELNGTSVGSATTSSTGVATLFNASLAGINAGSYASGVSASFAGDTGFESSTATNSLTVNTKELTGSFTAADKAYDGDRDADITGRTLSGVVAGDTVTLVGGTAQFDTKDVGTDKKVVGTGFALDGAAKANYTLGAVAEAKASITAKELTGHFTAADKVYDGGRDAQITGRSLDGVVGSEDVTLAGGTALFDTKDVGVDKDVTGSGFALDGVAKENYTLGSVAGTKANITPLAITGSFTAANKVYDGNRDATITGRSLSGKVAGDNVELVNGSAQFDTKDVGVNKTVTGTGFGLDGVDKGNYTLESVAGTSADITPKTIAGSFTAANKVYDGERDADITGRSVTGVVGQDQVSLTGGTAQFDTENVGVNKDVTGTGFELAGADKGNYALESSTLVAKASITAKQLTGHFTAADKVYDGERDAEITGRSLTGVLEGDEVSLTGGTAQFDTKDVGDDKDVTGTDFALDGAAKGNYTLGSVADATADITPKSITGSFTSANKVYDGNRNAEITGRSLGGVIGDDDVELVDGSAQFDNKDVGTAKDVTSTGFTLAGDDAGNYALVSSTLVTKANITAKVLTGSFKAADKLYDGTVAATITTRSLSGVVDNDDVTLVGGTATFVDANVGQDKTVTGTGFELSGADKGNYSLASSTLETTASIEYGWDGFLQPINDTAHQTGVNQSKFKLGQTIPAKFVITNAFGASVKQASNPTFSRSGNRGSCGTGLALDTVAEVVTPNDGVTYSWDGSKYHYNWSTKGLTAGEYRIYANLADGNKPYVDICLTK
jgi:trimeric autotransporter adhesin